ncbi:hypothetical protein [Micromonospora sp. CB01531]|uniref:hypothetical protein n=1 Tax=Micromonospora sp. CB01531 TaxID=1718947 RepID=UPI00093E91C6|nr:hypothetical protein [Micromonospora sp. CB01531]OKI79507.1 hypothetical protein A6A27_40560 [Micromonospora sp. CB01531]
MASSGKTCFHNGMTKTDGPVSAKRVATLGAWFLAFGLAVLIIEVWVGGDPFGVPSWGLNESSSVVGAAYLCWALWLRRQQC